MADYYHQEQTLPSQLKPTVKRRRLDAADARESILAAAEGLLVEGGPDALRLTEVATRAGVSHPNVLYHFGSVGELQAQLAQRVAVRLAGEMADVFANAMSGKLPLEQAIDAVFRVFDEGGSADSSPGSSSARTSRPSKRLRANSNSCAKLSRAIRCCRAKKKRRVAAASCRPSNS